MKLKKSVKKTLKKEIPSPDEPDESSLDSAEAMKAVIQDVSSTLISRSLHVKALALAIVSKSHIMFDGASGIAKTRLASRFAQHITGDDFKLFKLQLSKSTPSEEIFGPMNIAKLREEALYEYNVTGKLPDSHLAILDEVYRGPEVLLPRMLSVLNEREFSNGGEMIPCPLITAVGTTNFRLDTEELEAYADRWLINFKVTPLSTNEDRLKMLALSLKEEAGEQQINSSISLAQIGDLHEKRRKVVVPNAIREVYVQLIDRLRSTLGNNSTIKLTDRRIVQALRLAQSNAVIEGRKEVNVDDLMVVEYGLIFKGEASEENAFAGAYQSEVGKYQKYLDDETLLNDLKLLHGRYMSLYDPSLSASRKSKLNESIQECIARVSSTPINTQAVKIKVDELIADLENICREIALNA